MVHPVYGDSLVDVVAGQARCSCRRWIPSTRYQSFLLHNAANWPGEVVLREKEFGIWHEFSWAEYRDQVRLIALGLVSLGLRRGEVVAIIGRNRPNWLWSELAAHSIGCLTLGIYEDVLADEAGYLLTASSAAIAVCEDEEQVCKLLGSDLRWIVYHDERGMRPYDDARLVAWDSLLARGAALWRAEPARFEAEVARGHGQDVGILCTTSGTTAEPKLAMLQFRPFLGHVAAYLRRDPREPSDEYVSILPLPWIMEQVYAVAMPLLCRIRVSFPESHATAIATCVRCRTDASAAGARLWEQMAADVHARLMDAGRATRSLCGWAVKVGTAAVEQGHRHPRPIFWCFQPCATVTVSHGSIRPPPVARLWDPTPSSSFVRWVCRSGSSTARPRQPALTRCRSTTGIDSAILPGCRSMTPRSRSWIPTRVAWGRSWCAIQGCSRATFKPMPLPAPP